MQLTQETSMLALRLHAERKARMVRLNPPKPKPRKIEIIEHVETVPFEIQRREPAPVPAALKYSFCIDPFHGAEAIAPAPVPSMSYIKEMVAKAYGVSVLDIESARRTVAVVRPRQVAAYLCSVLTRRSLPSIGRAFGNRDHTTILFSRRKVEQLIAADSDFGARVEAVKLAILEGFHA